jgi:hypothetical protein
MLYTKNVLFAEAERQELGTQYGVLPCQQSLRSKKKKTLTPGQLNL